MAPVPPTPTNPLGWLINAYSQAAGYARAILTTLTLLAGILASGVLGHSTITLQIASGLTIAIQVLTRFTGLGDKPPTLAVDPTPPGEVQP